MRRVLPGRPPDNATQAFLLSRPKPARRLFATAILVMLLGVACGGSKGELHVSAASSLSEALTEVTAGFKSENPALRVSTTFASSATLATQILEGAPVSVFISANEAQADRVVAGGKADGFVPVATNSLVVATSGERVRTFADLAQPGLRLVIGAQDVPVGAYARESFARAEASGFFGAGFEKRVLANIRSEEANAGSVIAKIELGEADAAIVYRTDVIGRSGISTIAIPPEFNVVARYYVATLGGAHPEAARFVAYLLAPSAQDTLAKHGFGPP